VVRECADTALLQSETDASGPRWSDTGLGVSATAVAGPSRIDTSAVALEVGVSRADTAVVELGPWAASPAVDTTYVVALLALGPFESVEAVCRPSAPDLRSPNSAASVR